MSTEQTPTVDAAIEGAAQTLHDLGAALRAMTDLTPDEVSRLWEGAESILKALATHKGR